MHTQTWVVHLVACNIKHDVVLEKAVARNKKLSGISWKERHQHVVLEKAVARNTKNNESLDKTIGKMGPPNKESVP